MKKQLLLQQGFEHHTALGVWSNNVARKAITDGSIDLMPIESIKAWVHKAVPIFASFDIVSQPNEVERIKNQLGW